MRIGIDGRYAQARFPGIGRYAECLIGALASLATRNTFVVLATHLAAGPRLAALTGHDNIEVVTTGVAPVSLSEQRVLPGLIDSLDLDVFHSPYYVKPYCLSIPSVLTVYDTIPTCFPQYYRRHERWLVHFLKRLALRTSDHVVAISESTLASFVSTYRVPSHRITAIPLGVDSKRFHPLPNASIQVALHRLGLPSKYVLLLGTDRPHKNFAGFVEAWARAKSGGDSGALQGAVLVLAGANGPRYRATRDRILQLGLDREVLCLGPVDENDLPALYSGAACYVMPSLAEGFGLPVLEAMACGSPVACSSIPSLLETAGDAAVFFDPQDVRSMAAIICQLMTDENLREQCRRKGLRRAMHLSWTRTARRTLAIYNRAASGTSQSSNDALDNEDESP